MTKKELPSKLKMKKRSTANCAVATSTEPTEGSRYSVDLTTPTEYEKLKTRMYDTAVAHLKKAELDDTHEVVDREADDLMNEINFHLLQLQG